MNDRVKDKVSSTEGAISDAEEVARRKDDPNYQVTERWLRELKAWMDEDPKERTQAYLARRIGASAPTISNLVRGVYKWSQDVAAICRVTGITPPTQEVPPEVLAIFEEIMALDPSDRRAIIAMIRAMRANRQK